MATPESRFYIKSYKSGGQWFQKKCTNHFTIFRTQSFRALTMINLFIIIIIHYYYALNDKNKTVRRLSIFFYKIFAQKYKCNRTYAKEKSQGFKHGQTIHSNYKSKEKEWRPKNRQLHEK